jgi:glycerol-3-phosphate dehydrogenase
VAEGVTTAESLHELAKRHQIDMPICEEVYRVIYQGKTITQAMLDLTMRPLSAE